MFLMIYCSTLFALFKELNLLSLWTLTWERRKTFNIKKVTLHLKAKLILFISILSDSVSHMGILFRASYPEPYAHAVSKCLMNAALGTKSYFIKALSSPTATGHLICRMNIRNLIFDSGNLQCFVAFMER